MQQLNRRWEHQAPTNVERFMALEAARTPIRAMARELGISLSTLQQVRRRLGLPLRSEPMGGRTRRTVDMGVH
jgi:hypothetical protein